MKNLKKLFLLVFSFNCFIMLTNCQTEHDEIIQTENSFLKTGRLESHSKLSSYVEQLQRKQNETIQGKESSLEAINGFDIIYDQDMYIQEIDSATTYSIPIHKWNQHGGTFSNLVVKFSDTEPTQAFILNYEPEEEYLEDVTVNPQTPFKGKISSELINYDGSLDHLQETDQSGCTTITIKYCDWDNNEHGDVHLGTDNCTPGYYWFVTTTICSDELPQLMDIPTPGSGDPSATDYIDYDTAGGGLTGSDSTHPPLVVPNVTRTYTNLRIDGMSFEMSEWLTRDENLVFKKKMIDFLEEEKDLEDTELEIYLMVKSESSTVPWQNNSGIYNNVQSLQYTQTRDIIDYSRGYNYTEFKLVNGDIIMRGDFARTIDEDGNYVTTEPDQRTYYYSKEISRNFRIPEIYNTQQPISLDFLWNNFWSVVEMGVQICTPLEDIVILIDGKDFHGVEQSRAVSGLFIIIDNIPGGKVLKITRRTGTTISNAVPIVRRFANATYKTQKRLVKKHKGIIANMSSTRKGNFGEMATDVDLIEKGYQDLHVNRITDIDTPSASTGSLGIDHVFRNPETGQYIIVESKYGSSQIQNLADGTRQMSDAWIQGNNRLFDAVGQNQNLFDDIIQNGYERVVSRILPDGTISYKKLDANGYQILGNDGIFIP